MQELIEFKEDLEEFAKEKLSQLDAKIRGVEQKLNHIDLIEKKVNSLDFKDDIFKFEKRLCRVEKNLYGFDFSTNHNGDN